MSQKFSIKKRITTFINYRGISKYEFYKSTGITRGILDQDNGITESNILKFVETYPEVNINWLIIGKGDMLLTSEEQELLHNRAAGTSTPTLLPPIPLIPMDQLPQLLTQTSAPNLGNLKNNYIESQFTDADFYTRLRDLSLSPLYNSGDVIACKIIDHNDFIQWNKIYLIATDQGIIIKRILEGKDEQHFKMSSDNPSFHSFEISKENIKAMAIVRGGIHLE